MIKIVANCQWNSIFKNGFWEQNLIPSSFVICALAFNKCLLLSPFSFLFYADNVYLCVCVWFASIPVILNRVSFENLWHFWCYWHLREEKLRAAVHIMKVKSCLKLSEPKTEFCFFMETSISASFLATLHFQEHNYQGNWRKNVFCFIWNFTRSLLLWTELHLPKIHILKP